MTLVYAPDDASWHKDGLFYKEGLKGMVFRWNGEEWRKANMSKQDLISLNITKNKVTQ